MTPSSLTPAGTRSARAWSAATLGSGVEVAPPALSPPPVPVDESPPPQPVSARAELVIATAATARRRTGLLGCTGTPRLRDRRGRSSPARANDGAPGLLRDSWAS